MSHIHFLKAEGNRWGCKLRSGRFASITESDRIIRKAITWKFIIKSVEAQTSVELKQTV